MNVPHVLDAENHARPRMSGTSRACDNCRVRKLKCPTLLAHSTTGQTCARCDETGLGCTYNTLPKKRGPTSGRRLKRLALIDRLRTHSEQGSEYPPQISPIASVAASSPKPLQPDSWHRTPASPSTFPLDPSTFLWCQIFQDTPTSELREIDDFCAFGYAPFPIVDRESIVRQVDIGAQFVDLDFRCLLLAIATLNEASKLRINPARDTARLLKVVAILEQIRTQYDFANAPTADTLATSLFLFVAYNITGRHKRAFLYLAEAIALLDLVEDISDERTRVRLKRIEYVIFITEQATTSIYGKVGMRKLARRPIDIAQSANMLRMPSGLYRNEAVERSDEEAVDLLLHMARLHAAMDVDEIINMANPAPPSRSILTSLHDPASYKMQHADVAITRQWILAIKLPSLLQTCQSNSLAVMGLEGLLHDMSLSVLQWISALPEGQIRVVGLGKVTAIARTIQDFAVQIGKDLAFASVIRELAYAVCMNDHEGIFVPLLSDCVDKILYDLAPFISDPTMPDPNQRAQLLPPLQPEQTHPPPGISDSSVVLETAVASTPRSGSFDDLFNGDGALGSETQPHNSLQEFFDALSLPPSQTRANQFSSDFPLLEATTATTRHSPVDIPLWDDFVGADEFVYGTTPLTAADGSQPHDYWTTLLGS